jgi:hypothetical protein
MFRVVSKKRAGKIENRLSNQASAYVLTSISMPLSAPPTAASSHFSYKFPLKL